MFYYRGFMKIIMMMAQTADGIMAKNSNDIPDWTSKADKKVFVEETKKHKVIIMGRSTFETIGRPLPRRLNLILTPDPEKFEDKNVEGELEFFSGTPEEVIAHLSDRGYKSCVLAGGAYTNSLFLKSNLVDELLVTISPKMFGNGMTIAQGSDLNIELKLLENKNIDENTVMLRYKVLK